MESAFSITSDSTTLTPELIEQIRTKAKKSLYFFCKFVLGYKDMVRHIHRPVCKLLEDRTVHKLSVTLPRGWFKTTVISISYPMWEAINNPNVRILLVQNTFTNAVSKLRAIREHFEANELFRLLFPEILPSLTSKWSSESLCVNRTARYPESTFECAGTRTQATSRHYDVIIEDDTVAPDLNELGMENVTPTKDDISQAIGLHRLVPPLLVHPRDSRNVVVGTRWFELDLLSWIAHNEPYYSFYVRACRETNNQPDPGGTLTFPERFDAETLDGLRTSMGPYMYSCLYMNTPMSSDTMVFKKDWFKYYVTEPRHTDLAVYTTVDLAGDPRTTRGKDQDYNVVLTAAKDLQSGIIYVLDYWQKRANPGEVIDQIFKHYQLYKFIKLGIEGVAYQATLQYWVEERRRDEQFYIESLTHGSRSKEMRIRGLQPMFAAGRILLRVGMTQLQAEAEAFPLGAHDDIIDCLALQQSLWAKTLSVKEREQDSTKFDPMSLDWAEVQLRGRHHGLKRTHPFAVFETGNSQVLSNGQILQRLIDEQPKVEYR